ncbi:hypothetical protein AURDEDRAFT_87930 [Auricularia subglabra TFB-10046 SS5]|nr:hypothetical protein AURDEDRAFT_87930 [Auricularia subglabra TFB-10046 SS5]
MLNLILVAAAASLAAAQSYLPGTAPDKSEEGQFGTNRCGTTSSQNSTCQNLFINSADDFCIYAPPTINTIGAAERFTVSYCLRSGYGTRLIPNGAIRGVHFVQTPDYVQITGVGDLTSLNIRPGDGGGEMDPHGADGKGNPIGALVFGSSFGKEQQYHEWTNFVGANLFCLRACKDGPRAKQFCGHIWDEMGCYWNMPGNYAAGAFDNCAGDSTEPMGIYSSRGADGKMTTTTWRQGQEPTPAAHQPGATSKCTPLPSPSNKPVGGGVFTPPPPGSTTTTSSSVPTSTSTATSSTGTSSSATSTGSTLTSGSTSSSPSISNSGSPSPTESTDGPAPTNPDNAAASARVGGTVALVFAILLFMI